MQFENFNLAERRYDVILSSLKGIQSRLDEQVILQKSILDVREARIYTNLSESSIYKLSANGSIPTHKPNGRKLYFLKEDLDNWMLNKSNDAPEIDSEQFVKEKLKELNSFNHD